MALYLEGTPVLVADQANKLWLVYEAEQRTARGLLAGESLDTRRVYGADGRLVSSSRLPNAQAVTRAYATTVVSSDAAIAAMPVDAYAQSKNGVGGLNLSAAKDETLLDPRLKTALSSTDPKVPAASETKVSSGGAK